MPTPNTYTFLDGLLRGNVGGGDVSGPASSVVNRIATFADSTGKVIKDSGVLITGLILAAGTVPFAANQSMGTHKLTNLATPTVGTDAATKAYVDASTSSVTADGVTLQLVSGVMSAKPNGIGNASLRQGAACTIIGNATAALANVADISISADGNVLMRTAGVLTSGKIAAANISATAAITLSQLADGSACSLVGRSANSSGPHADIAAGTNGFVFIRRANAVTAGLLLDENVDAAADIAGSKIDPAFGAQNVTSSLYFGGLDNSAIGGSGDAATFRGGDALGASGTRNGGGLTLRSGTGATAAGNVQILRGSAAVLSALVGGTTLGESTLAQLTLGSTASLTLAGVSVMSWGSTIQLLQTPGVLEFGISVATPTWRQAVATAGGVTGAAMLLNAQDVSGNGSSGAALTVRAGDATGGSGTRNGGALTLRSGTGATAPGVLLLQGGLGTTGVRIQGRNNGNSAYLDLLSWDSTTSAGTVTIGDPLADTWIRARVGGGISFRTGSGQMASMGATAMELSTQPTFQFALAVVLPKIIQETDPTAATGDLFTIAAQDCAAITGTVAGAMLLRAGDANGASGSRTGGALTLRSGTGATAAGDVSILRGSASVLSATATSGLTVTIGAGTGPIRLVAGGATDERIYFTNGSYEHQLTTGGLTLGTNTSGDGTMVLKYRNTTAQLSLGVAAGVSLIGFFGSALSAQAVDMGALTASFGTADGIVADVGGAFNQTTLNNNFQDLATKINTLRTVLRGYGLMA